LRLVFAGVALICLALSPAHATEAESDASPFIYAPSALAPAPSRGWVVLLPGDEELGFKAIASHYEKIALLLNANGFDTLMVPYEDAYDEDIDGEADDAGTRIAAVTARAVRWMHRAHPDSEGDQGAIIAWGEGAQGLAVLAAAGSSYPLPNVTAAIAFYPEPTDSAPFASRLPMLIEMGAADENVRALKRYLDAREAGSVEPEVVLQDEARRGFDIEAFASPKTVRSTPLIGATVTYAYNAAATRAAQQKMLSFLKARLEAPE